MKLVSLRELRQNASAPLRQVERGDLIEITDRGLPVALLPPVPAGGLLVRNVRPMATRGRRPATVAEDLDRRSS